MKSIIIANTAGGVGKSTTAHNLALAASEYGKKVLLVDADPGAGLTFACGIENPRVSIREFLLGEFSLEAAIIKSGERFEIIASSSRLLSIDMDQVVPLAKLLEIFTDYELVIVDTPTGPSRITTYFMAIADLILTPTTAQVLALRGALHSKDFAQSVGHSSALQLLVTMASQPLSQDLKTLLSEDFELIEPAIRFSNAISNSQSQGKSILSLDSNSEVAADYREITYFLLEKLELI